MQNNLQQIFKSITPSNIQDKKLISDSMEIFIDLLYEKSKESIDIKTLTDERNDNLFVKEEIVKIYLSDLYIMIKHLRSNKPILDRLKKLNMKLRPGLYLDSSKLAEIGDKLIINYFIVGGTALDVIYDDDNILPEAVLTSAFYKFSVLENNIINYKNESFFMNRLFKQNKGLIEGIVYIYDFVNNIITDNEEKMNIKITENSLFELSIEGSLDNDIYEHSVGYISHPLGYITNYTRKYQQKLEDSFLIGFNYNDLIVNVTNITETENYNNKVIGIYEEYINNNKNITIYFDDNTYLKQSGEPLSVIYYNSANEIIKEYSSDFRIDLSYNYEYGSKIKEDFGISLDSTITDSITITDDVVISII